MLFWVIGPTVVIGPTKTLLLSMAKTRLGLIPTVPFDDVIDGKGQGLSILEYVGKFSITMSMFPL
jgi:hypothetical protein